MRVSLGPVCKPNPEQYQEVKWRFAKMLVIFAATIFIVIGAVAIAKKGVNMGHRVISAKEGIAYVVLGAAFLGLSALRFYKQIPQAEIERRQAEAASYMHFGAMGEATT